VAEDMRWCAGQGHDRKQMSRRVEPVAAPRKGPRLQHVLAVGAPRVRETRGTTEHAYTNCVPRIIVYYSENDWKGLQIDPTTRLAKWFTQKQDIRLASFTLFKEDQYYPAWFPSINHADLPVVYDLPVPALLSHDRVISVVSAMKDTVFTTSGEKHNNISEMVLYYRKHDDNQIQVFWRLPLPEKDEVAMEDAAKEFFNLMYGGHSIETDIYESLPFEFEYLPLLNKKTHRFTRLKCKLVPQ